MNARRVFGAGALAGLLLAALAMAFPATAHRVVRCGPNLPCITDDALYVSDFGATVDDGTADQVAINAALAAASPNGIIRYAKGTYTITGTGNASGIVMNRCANCVHEGVGPGTVIDGTGAQNTFNYDDSFPYVQANVTIRDLTVTAGSANAINIDERFFPSVTVERVLFDLDAGGIGIGAAGAHELLVLNNRVESDGDGQFLSLFRGVTNAVIRGNRIDNVQNAIIIDTGTAGEEPSGYIEIDGNLCEQWWWMEPMEATNAADTSGTTYTDTGLADTAGALTGLGSNDTIRVLPVRATSGATVNYFPGNKITDATPGFVAAGVLRGDIIRPDGTNMEAVVWQVEDADELWHYGWRDRTTRRRVAPPNQNTTYKIHRTILGRRHASTTCTATACTLDGFGWFDFQGIRITGAPPIPNGTLYETTGTHSNYCIQLETSNVRHSRITNNTLIGPWSDGISVGAAFSTVAAENIVANNTVIDGQDQGITINGQRTIVTGNQVYHNGAGGICVNGSNNLVAGNVGTDNVWTNSVNTTGLGDIWLTGVANNVIARNILTRADTAQTQSRHGIAIDGAGATGNVFEGNVISGHATASIRFVDGDVTGAILRGNTVASYSLHASSTYTIEGGTAFTQATLPAALNGSWVACSDCTAANPCAGSGAGSLARRAAGAWNCL